MSFVPAAPRSPHWTFTAVATGLATPALLFGLERAYRSMQSCLGAYGARLSDPELPDACSNVTALVGVLGLAAIGYVAATTVTGLCVGVVEGKRRRGFGHRRRVAVVVVGVAAPWALLLYAAGYGIGRLVPPPPVDTTWADGCDAARRTLDFLSAGGEPDAVPAQGFLTDESVHLDARLHYARHYGSAVTYTQTSTVAFGSTAFVTGALVANAIGNSSARSRAERMARPQWREHQLARVVLTPTRTWCQTGGRWLSFHHSGVLEYHLDQHGVVLVFGDTEPLRLTGPTAWVHAVLFAYFRFGASALPTTAFLLPIRALPTPASTPPRSAASPSGT
ncbi:hypothetical protein [Micromonospora sp. DT31]|uniref:hypothetical protein n=1 Tax=Micromonospora sp. DT31 TaxID=3393434 RepID=UPI003CF71945